VLIVLVVVVMLVGGVALIIAAIGSSPTQDELLRKTENPQIPTDWLGAKHARKEAERAASVVHANDNLRSTLLESEQFDRRHEQKVELENAQHENQIIILENSTHITRSASEQNLDAATYLSIQQRYEFNRLDLDRRWHEIEQDLKAGFIFQQKGYQELSLLREYINTLYTQSQTAQGRELGLLEEHITFMEGDFRERQRLLQADYRKEISGSNEDSESGGDSQSSVPTEQIQIPPKRARSRSRKLVAE
jgi:hypothetical protein